MAYNLESAYVQALKQTICLSEHHMNVIKKQQLFLQ